MRRAYLLACDVNGMNLYGDDTKERYLLVHEDALADEEFAQSPHFIAP